MSRTPVDGPVSPDDVRLLLADLASAAPDPIRTDLDAAGLAWRDGRPEPVLPRWWRAAVARPLVAVPALVAAVVVLLFLGLAAVPARVVAPPATPVPGPVGLPSRLFVPPDGTPSLRDAPLDRVAYVGGVGAPSQFSLSAPPDEGPGPLLVVSPAGAYRTLPPEAGASAAFALAPDGSALAWALEPVDLGPSTLVRLDVRTGREQRVELLGDYRRGVTVAALAFAPDGAELLAEVSSRVDVSSGGPGELVRVDRAGAVTPVCDCTGLLDVGADGLPVVRSAPDGVAGVRLAPADLTDEGGSRLAGVRSPQWVLDPAGRLWQVESQDTGSDTGSLAGRSQRQTAVGRRTVAAGAVAEADPAPVRLDLGDAWLVHVLAADGSGVLVAVRDRFPVPGTSGGQVWGPLSVVRVDASGRRVVSEGVDAPVDVTLAARDLAWAGETVQADRPTLSTADAVRARARAAVEPLLWLLGIGAGVGALVVLASPSGERLLGRLRPGRGGLRRAGAGVTAVAGVALLLTPSVVSDLWRGREPGIPGQGGVVLPRDVTDAPVAPRRAFERAGRPMTTQLTFAVRATVAGRPGVYGVDAQTTWLVRLDGLPGLDGDGDPELSRDGHVVTLGGTSVDLRTARPVPRTADPGRVRTARPVALPDGRTVRLRPDGALEAVLPDGQVRSFEDWTQSRVDELLPVSPGVTDTSPSGTAYVTLGAPRAGHVELGVGWLGQGPADPNPAPVVVMTVDVPVDGQPWAFAVAPDAVAASAWAFTGPTPRWLRFADGRLQLLGAVLLLGVGAAAGYRRWLRG